MFSPAHFIWLGSIALVIVLAFVLIKKFNPSHLFVQHVVTAMMIAFKLFHVALSMKDSPHGGMVLSQTQLSFHLCSVQVYLLIFINLTKNEKLIKTIKSFMVPCMVIGAFMSLIIPVEGVSPAVPRVWQYMLIHALLVFYGFYLMLVERVDLSLPTYLTNLKIMLLLTVIGFVMNSVLEQYGTNFLFLRYPPANNLPILNLDNGWYAYFISLVIICVILLGLVQLPFIIKSLEAKNKEEQ